jgi:hypothetical protein
MMIDEPANIHVPAPYADTKRRLVPQVRVPGSPDFDRWGNRYAREGCDRCDCGAKYWEKDRCHSCGKRWEARFRGTEDTAPEECPKCRSEFKNFEEIPWGDYQHWECYDCGEIFNELDVEKTLVSS